MPHVTANGVRLYYEVRGSGVPIVGIHGAGSSAVFWEDAADRLAGLGRAIIYDRRGCSRSERPDPYERTSIGEHADDARELLVGLDAAPAILVGRSYGATVALDLALRHPELVRGLVLLEAGPIGLSPAYDAWFDDLRRALDERAAEGRVDLVGETAMREALGAWEELPQVARDVFTANGQALLAEVRGGESLTDIALLPELQTPTLVVTADDSADMLRDASEALARAVPGARVVRVPGGHLIDPAGEVVLDFAAELATA